jgi:hypothetical protein
LKGILDLLEEESLDNMNGNNMYRALSEEVYETNPVK